MGIYSFRNYADKVKRYYRFTSKEARGLLITIVIIAFLFSFKDWGVSKFDFSLGIGNFIKSFIIVAISLLVYQSAQRLSALLVGYKVAYKSWFIGLVIGLVLIFVSNGRFFFLAPGAAVITLLPVHRLGMTFYNTSHRVLGWIAMAGPIACMLLAVLLKLVSPLFPGSLIMQKAIMVNIWIALFGMLPIHPFDGSKTFFGSRYIYVFVLASMIICALLLTYVNPILALIGALVIGLILAFLFFVYFDKMFTPTQK